MARGKGKKKAMSRKKIQQKYVNKMKSEKSEEWHRKERNEIENIGKISQRRRKSC